MDGFRHCFGIRQAAVIAAELVVDGISQGQALYFFVAIVIEIGCIQNPGCPSIAITEGMDIDKIEMGNETLQQDIGSIGLPIC